VTEKTRSFLWQRHIVKRFVALIAALFVLLILCLASLIWQNNRTVEPPSPRSITDGLENGIHWLMNNREAILGQHNAMLWWFVKESADLTNDERLHALFSEYKKRHLEPNPKTVWWRLFDAQSRAPVAIWQLEHLPDYNLYFIYGATCDAALGKEEIIRRQNDREFCADYHPFSPACVTHQLMGVRLAQRSGCFGLDDSKQLATALQEKIVNQLVWDPRIVDVYVQRVLMLVESGMTQKIKPVWLQRVLDAQLTDGGWDNFYSLFPVNHKYHVGITYLPVIRARKSNFHTTAQGVFLLSLLDGMPHAAKEN
jgi:hypothetical protein